MSETFGKDLSYLRRAVEERGISFLTITLPDLGKVIDRSLDQGFLDLASFPRGVTRNRRGPVFLRELFNKVFDNDMVLRNDPCVDAITFLRQICFCCKKLRLECPQSKLEETLDEFFQIEAGLPPSYPNTWDSDIPEWLPRCGHPLWGDQDLVRTDLFEDTKRSSVDWSLLRAIARRVTSSIGEPDWWSLTPKHGPGVVSEGPVVKYDFPYWPKKLDLWFPYDWFGSGDLNHREPPSSREPSSRLIAVPKSMKGPRLICAEPTAHQWIQQCIWRWLEARVIQSPYLSDSITFRSQENSRKRALNASIDRKHCTIDLSSASDRISTRLVEYIFQGSSILDGLHACRTRSLSQNLTERHGSLCVLRKFSTMGSAVTFPIQSILFAILTVFSMAYSQGKKVSDLTDNTLKGMFREITVFGDDIIAPREYLSAITEVFTSCGLKINSSKTFSDGYFRESCGMDAYKGYDVTPAYLLEPYGDSPTSMASVVEASNNFFSKGYWRTAYAIESSIPISERKLLHIGSMDDGTFGLRSFCGTSTDHLRMGWDSSLQRMYSISLQITSKVRVVRGRGEACLSQYFFEKPDPLYAWSSGQASSVRLRKRRTRVYVNT